jgi:hypothetical protein
MASDEEVQLSAAEQAAHNDALRAAIEAAKNQKNQHLSDMHEENKRRQAMNEGERLAAELASVQAEAEANGTTLSGIAAMRAAATPVSEKPDASSDDKPEEVAAPKVVAVPVAPAAPVLPVLGTKEVTS